MLREGPFGVRSVVPADEYKVPFLEPLNANLRQASPLPLAWSHVLWKAIPRMKAQTTATTRFQKSGKEPRPPEPPVDRAVDEAQLPLNLPQKPKDPHPPLREAILHLSPFIIL